MLFRSGVDSGEMTAISGITTDVPSSSVNRGATPTGRIWSRRSYVEYTEDGNKKQIWIEDIDSLKAKLSLITENNLAGVGSWQKGMESDEVWKIIKEELEIK